MKIHIQSLLAFLLLGIVGPSVFGIEVIPVTNPSFESPGLVQNDYTHNLNGWTNPGLTTSSFIERVSGVTPADGGQYLGMDAGAAVYQDPGRLYQPNTVYRLRVAIGNRPGGFSNPGNLARYTLTEPAGIAARFKDASATGFSPGTFRDVPAVFVNTAVTTDLAYRPIRIRLSDLSLTNIPGLRSHFDQIRLDMGTVAEFTTVTNTNDSGDGSLREAISNAASLPGPDTVTFAPSLSGQVILLASEIAVNDSEGVTVNASNLPAGLTISGNSSVRQFHLTTGRLTLRGLTLTGGRGLSAENSLAGGAVRTYEGTTFAAYNCLFQSNTADKTGGALSNRGTSTLEGCLFAFNGTRTDSSTGGSSGAITNIGSLVVRRCTFFGNSTFAGTTGGSNAHSAGAILSVENLSAPGSNLTIEHCTFSGNTAGGDSSVTKAAVIVTTTATVKSSILDGNFGGPDLIGVGANIVRVGANYIGSFSGSSYSGPAPLSSGLNLGTLENNGGRTLTMALLPGSAGINAAVGSTATMDQRGFFIVGIPDLGAFELGGRTSVFPRLFAPRSVTTTGTRAKIRGTSKYAAQVTFSVAGQRGVKRTTGSPARWSAKVTNLKRPVTRVSIRATSASGNRSTRVVSVKRN